MGDVGALCSHTGFVLMIDERGSYFLEILSVRLSGFVHFGNIIHGGQVSVDKKLSTSVSSFSILVCHNLNLFQVYEDNLVYIPMSINLVCRKYSHLPPVWCPLTYV